MPTNISLKNVPDDIMEKLRQRARTNHRSLQGELISILEIAVAAPEMSLDMAESHLRRLKFSTKGDSAGWIRELRDAR